MLVLQSNTAQAFAPIERRFWRVREAADACGLSHVTADWLVATRQLPVVTIPSPRDDVTRRIIRVPAVWLDLWLDMRGGRLPHDLPKHALSSDGPKYLSVAEAADSLAISLTTLYALIQAQRFVPVVSSGSHIRIATCRLDAWCAELIKRAERDWACTARFARAVAR